MARSIHNSTSKERDAETGLDYFGARYFSGAQGRFTSSDRVIVTPARMVDPQRFNLYAYGRNNPLAFIDPNGEDILFVNDTEEGRNKALALIRKNMSATEAANIDIRKAKDGSYEAYIVNDTAIGKDASTGYKNVAGLIGDHSLLGGGMSATFTDLGKVSSIGDRNAVFAVPGSKYASVIATEGDHPGGTQQLCCGGNTVYQGWSPDFVNMYHELIGETMKYRKGNGNLLGDPGLDSRTVIKIENEIRAYHRMNPRTGSDHGSQVITVDGKAK
jgi:RHS repeat-associated protein